MYFFLAKSYTLRRVKKIFKICSLLQNSYRMNLIFCMSGKYTLTANKKNKSCLQCVCGGGACLVRLYLMIFMVVENRLLNLKTLQTLNSYTSINIK